MIIANVRSIRQSSFNAIRLLTLNISQRFNTTYTSNIATEKKKKEKKATTRNTDVNTCDLSNLVNLIVSIFKPTA